MTTEQILKLRNEVIESVRLLSERYTEEYLRHEKNVKEYNELLELKKQSSDFNSESALQQLHNQQIELYNLYIELTKELYVKEHPDIFKQPLFDELFLYAPPIAPITPVEGVSVLDSPIVFNFPNNGVPLEKIFEIKKQRLFTITGNKDSQKMKADVVNLDFKALNNKIRNIEKFFIFFKTESCDVLAIYVEMNRNECVKCSLIPLVCPQIIEEVHNLSPKVLNGNEQIEFGEFVIQYTTKTIIKYPTSYLFVSPKIVEVFVCRL